MEYRISTIDDYTLIKVLGPFNRNAIHSVSKFLKPFLKGNSRKITLDIDNLVNEKDMVFHVGLLNAFRKEIDQAGGTMQVQAENVSLRQYLSAMRLDRIFTLL